MKEERKRENADTKRRSILYASQLTVSRHRATASLQCVADICWQSVQTLQTQSDTAAVPVFAFAALTSSLICDDKRLGYRKKKESLEVEIFKERFLCLTFTLD